MNPSVSIIVIAFNEARRIGPCLEALSNQIDAPAYEVIVIDDGSTDKTAEAAAAFAPHVRVVSLGENQGRGAARLAGVAEAKGGYVGFVDADIVVPADWVARCVAAIHGHAAVGGIAVPDGDVAPLARLSGATLRPVPGSMPVTGNNVLFDAAVLARYPFDAHSRLGEDFRLAARLLDDGLSLLRVPGLEVTHNETKSYAKSFRWLFASGVDATSLLFEFRRVRLPDLVWAGWVGAWVLAFLGAILDVRMLLLGLLATVAAGSMHAVTRFKPWPRPHRFVFALVADIPLIAAYLAGRTVGLLNKLSLRNGFKLRNELALSKKAAR